MLPADTQVIEQLEAATAGSPGLSEAVLKAIGWDWECMGCPGGGMWKRPDEALYCGPLPAVTESAEAARELVPEGLQVVAKTEPGRAWEIRLYSGATTGDGDLAVISKGATLALALCGAAVKASHCD